ncbi:DUF3050 domain-containing protein [Aquimarina litoralis]|uniref:DUF3050 domain-containing protein n=1 Tax=Aquimarina litoralis TaxID=584605 RepID=UPI001C58AA8D|nr:DUF3050 domain-containing protein [Aquimarina litoralis]MBW1295323.1 DUF3050 domain-containing protein [Aquimarina litoralis]
MNIDQLTRELEPLRMQLEKHPLYNQMKEVEDVRVFMENHVFAVWDFMSLLKSLQIHLTTVNLPWIPSSNPKIRRFVNEIVLGEESDIDRSGKSVSHFEMYLDAMEEVGADTGQINALIKRVSEGEKVQDAINDLVISESVKMFMKFTFDVIATNKPHIIAAVFTFGREDLIPDMFIEIVKGIQNNSDVNLEKLVYYLERHIELDGDEHGPLSLEMVSSLCKTEQQWEEALLYSKMALANRITLWSSISEVFKTVL